MNKIYTVDSFFAGTGGIDEGLKQTHHFKSIWANEFDKWADQTYHLNFPNAKLTTQDIKKIPASQIPYADVMVGGFPCQPFSIAGYRKGFKDKRGTLFFEILRAIIAKRPKAILLENVKNLVGHHQGRTFKVIWEALVKNGYDIKWKVMNTKDYGNLPQNRERIYIAGFRDKTAYDHFQFPKPIQRTNTIHDIFNFKTKFPSNLIYTPQSVIYPRLIKSIKSTNIIYEYRRSYVRPNKSGICPAITSICGEGGDNTPIIYNYHHQIRPLTPKECFKVQGFPDDFKLPKEAKSHLLKQAGNAVSIPVIKRIGIKLYQALQYADNTTNNKKRNNNQFSNTNYKNISIDNNINKTTSNKIADNKYILIKLSTYGKYQGQAQTIVTNKQYNNLIARIPNNKLYNDKQYYKTIRYKRQDNFYLIEHK